MELITGRAAPLRDADTIVDVVRRRAERTPAQSALLFLEDGERASSHYSYRELWSRAAQLARALEPLRGERVILLYEAGLEYVAAFLACLASGAVAVPSYPPAGRRTIGRFSSIVLDCAPKAVLTTSAFARELRKHGAFPDWIAIVASDELDAAAQDVTFRGRDSDLVMLQYTSGSTGSPKGIQLSHRNLMANCEAVYQWLGPNEERRGCIWLPPFHDMGLLGGVLQPLYAGFPLVFMSPLHFVQRPARWLEAIDRYRITLSGAPDFAYQSCVDRVPEAERAKLDLSCWRETFCGAEQIRPRTLARFSQAYAQAGFDSRSFNPCYGLAEATLLVSGKPPNSEPVSYAFPRSALQLAHGEEQGDREQDGRTVLISSGVTPPGNHVRIVDPSTLLPLPDGNVGEIWFAGDSVALGYWQKPEVTAATFGWRLEGELRPFLRTGDLGLLREGELFVTGRIKDLIIVAGRNHAAEDVEATAQTAHPLLESATAVAFSYEHDGGEQLGLVIELARTAALDAPENQQIQPAVVRAVTGVHGIAPAHVHLCRAGSVPRTTSGKVQRSECRSWFKRSVLLSAGASAQGAL